MWVIWCCAAKVTCSAPDPTPVRSPRTRFWTRRPPNSLSRRSCTGRYAVSFANTCSLQVSRACSLFPVLNRFLRRDHKLGRLLTTTKDTLPTKTAPRRSIRKPRRRCALGQNARLRTKEEGSRDVPIIYCTHPSGREEEGRQEILALWHRGAHHRQIQGHTEGG